MYYSSGAPFLVVGFPFQSISSSLGVGFFNSVQFGVSIQFQVVSFCFCSVSFQAVSCPGLG